MKKSIEQRVAHYELVRELARTQMVAFVVSCFTKLSNRFLRPLVDRILGLFKGRKTQVYQASDDQLFPGTRLAVEDCVVLYPSRHLKLDALKFFATRELTSDLRSTLKDYFKTHTDPTKYGDIMEEAFLKGASPPPTYPTHTGSVERLGLTLLPPPTMYHNVRHSLSQDKAKANQVMWNFKKKHKGLTPREYDINKLQVSIDHIEMVISGEIKSCGFISGKQQYREQYRVDHIEESKAKLKVLQASEEYAPDNPWGSVSGSINWSAKLTELSVAISHMKVRLKDKQRIAKLFTGEDAYELVMDNNELEKHITKLIIARNELKKAQNNRFTETT